MYIQKIINEERTIIIFSNSNGIIGKAVIILQDNRTLDRVIIEYSNRDLGEMGSNRKIETTQTIRKLLDKHTKSFTASATQEISLGAGFIFSSYLNTIQHEPDKYFHEKMSIASISMLPWKDECIFKEEELKQISEYLNIMPNGSEVTRQFEGIQPPKCLQKFIEQSIEIS